MWRGTSAWPNFRSVRLRVLGAVVVVLAASAALWLAQAARDPGRELPGECAVYLTWRGDPCTTMTVSWICDDPAAQPPAVLHRAGHGGTWDLTAASSQPFPHTPWRIHHAELTGLSPGALHHFIIAGEGKVRSFRTLPPTLESPLRFAQGGDVGKDFPLMDRVNAAAAAGDPAFVVWGGDLAYCDGKPEKAWRWRRFFQSVHRHLRAPDGRLLPVVVVPGNHEVYKHGGEDPAACYLAAFPPVDGRTYGALDAGDYLSLILLDSGHLAECDGAQAAWLDEALGARRGRPHVLPVYHTGAYPSARDFDNSEAREVRAHWVPLFEQHGVRLAFEHHDHAFKVTHPIRAGRVDPQGVVYAGDGAWGVGTRVVHTGAWYLQTAAKRHHFFEVTLEPARRTVRAVAPDGSEFHRFVQERDGVLHGVARTGRPGGFD